MSAEEAIVTILIVCVLFLVAGSALSLVRWALSRADDRGDWTEEGNGRIRW